MTIAGIRLAVEVAVEVVFVALAWAVVALDGWKSLEGGRSVAVFLAVLVTFVVLWRLFGK